MTVALDEGMLSPEGEALNDQIWEVIRPLVEKQIERFKSQHKR